MRSTTRSDSGRYRHHLSTRSTSITSIDGARARNIRAIRPMRCNDIYVPSHNPASSGDQRSPRSRLRNNAPRDASAVIGGAGDSRRHRCAVGTGFGTGCSRCPRWRPRGRRARRRAGGRCSTTTQRSIDVERARDPRAFRVTAPRRPRSTTRTPIARSDDQLQSRSRARRCQRREGRVRARVAGQRFGVPTAVTIGRIAGTAKLFADTIDRTCRRLFLVLAFAGRHLSGARHLVRKPDPPGHRALDAARVPALGAVMALLADGDAARYHRALSASCC